MLDYHPEEARALLEISKNISGDDFLTFGLLIYSVGVMIAAFASLLA